MKSRSVAFQKICIKFKHPLQLCGCSIYIEDAMVFGWLTISANHNNNTWATKMVHDSTTYTSEQSELVERRVTFQNSFAVAILQLRINNSTINAA